MNFVMNSSKIGPWKSSAFQNAIASWCTLSRFVIQSNQFASLAKKLVFGEDDTSLLDGQSGHLWIRCKQIPSTKCSTCFTCGRNQSFHDAKSDMYEFIVLLPPIASNFFSLYVIIFTYFFTFSDITDKYGPELNFCLQFPNGIYFASATEVGEKWAELAVNFMEENLVINWLFAQQRPTTSNNVNFVYLHN